MDAGLYYALVFYGLSNYDDGIKAGKQAAAVPAEDASVASSPVAKAEKTDNKK